MLLPPPPLLLLLLLLLLPLSLLRLCHSESLLLIVMLRLLRPMLPILHILRLLRCMQMVILLQGLAVRVLLRLRMHLLRHPSSSSECVVSLKAVGHSMGNLIALHVLVEGTNYRLLQCLPNGFLPVLWLLLLLLTFLRVI